MKCNENEEDLISSEIKKRKCMQKNYKYYIELADDFEILSIQKSMNLLSIKFQYFLKYSILLVLLINLFIFIWQTFHFILLSVYEFSDFKVRISKWFNFHLKRKWFKNASTYNKYTISLSFRSYFFANLFMAKFGYEFLRGQISFEIYLFF